MMNRLLTCAMAVFVVTSICAEDEWPQWRGVHGNGHATGVSDLPVNWSKTDNIKWKAVVPGRGHSSPVISGEQVWVTTALETKATREEIEKRKDKILGDYTMLALLSRLRLQAICIDRKTGKIIRTVDLMSVEQPQGAHRLNSYATPTPILRKGRLYCHFGAYGNACVDTGNGKVLWVNQDLVVQHINGPVSKPILWKGLMIFHMDGGDQQFIAALDAASGKLAWKTDRSGELPENPQVRKSYSTPLIANVNGHSQLVSPAADWLFAYDPLTGKELWKMKYGKPGYSNVASPVAGNGLVYLPTGYGHSEMVALRLREKQKPEIVWRRKKGAPRTSSPILVEDNLFVVSDNGILSCLDAMNGMVKWQQRLEGNYSASPLYAGGYLYFVSQEGKIRVVKPGDQYQAVALNDMGSPIRTSPAAVGKAIYLRSEDGLYRIEKTR